MLKIVKRKNLSKKKQILIQILAVVFALCFA